MKAEEGSSDSPLPSTVDPTHPRQIHQRHRRHGTRAGPECAADAHTSAGQAPAARRNRGLRGDGGRMRREEDSPVTRDHG